MNPEMNDRHFLNGLEATPEGRPATGVKSTSRILEGNGAVRGLVEQRTGVGCGGRAPAGRQKKPRKGARGLRTLCAWSSCEEEPREKLTRIATVVQCRALPEAA